MATLVLGTLGGAVGGPAGKLIGTIAGSFIDQWLFPPKAIKGPRLEQIQLPTFDQGSPAPWVQGKNCRLSCQVIWISKVTEIKNTHGGGKGGGKPKTITYDYYVDIALGLARQAVQSSSPLRVLWANGQVIYNAAGTSGVSSTAVKAIAVTTKTNLTTYCLDKADQEQIIFEHQTDKNFFKNFITGANLVTVAGFANAANNGIFSVLSVVNDYNSTGKGRMTVLKCTHQWETHPTYQGGVITGGYCAEFVFCAAGVNENAGASVSFNQGPDTWDKGLIEDVQQYNGAASQTPNSVMEAFEGVGNVPAYRGTTYVLLKNLKITSWGGTIPVFEALIEEYSARNLGDAIVAVVTRNAALTSDDVDVSAISGGVSMDGLVLMGPKSSKEVIQLLMNTYSLDVQDTAAVEGGTFKNRLKFFPKTSSDVRAISDGDRGARLPDSNSEGKDLIAIEQTDPATLPSVVTVTFSDIGSDYQPGTRSFRRSGATVEIQNQLSLPITMTATQATTLAKKIMWEVMTNGRFKVFLTLPPTYIDLAEGDRLTVSDVDGLGIRARVTKVDRGNNGLIDVEALQEEDSVYAAASDEVLPGA